MKAIITAAIAAVALTAVAGAAQARPAHRHHVRVCSTHHHHRSCQWVWR